VIESDAINATIDRSQHVVLVVDDNPATRYSTTRILRAAGFQTAEAGSGAEGIERAMQGVSAVVLDVHLPDMSGFDVCRQLRATPSTATVPVIHLSAEFTRNQDRVAGLDAGADAYLVHPVEPAILIATLQALVRARTAEDRLRRSELRFRAIYDHAPSGIVLLDRDGRVVDANPAMLRLLGYTHQELDGRVLADLAPADVRTRALAKTTEQDEGAGRPWEGEFPLLNANGALVHLQWSMSPHVEPGLRIAIASDASERRKLEEQRRDVLEREQVARAAAERHSRTKDDFIAVLSHELRTPLNAIVGWVAVLMRRNPSSDVLKGLEAIERNVKAQARIISDILDVSRINSGKLHLEREQVDPAAVIVDSLGSLRTSLADKRLRVDLDVERAHGPAWLDPARFQQIFWNLMTNAIKFSEPGSSIRVTLVREGPRLLLDVQDFGRGIARDFLPRLFDRFSQSDAPGHRTHGGLGLGLSIVRHIAELHGGGVRAESAGLGKGATMHVELNVEGTAEDEAAPSEPGSTFGSDDLAGERPLDGLEVLVVEDDADASEMLQVILTDRGAHVRTATNFETALQALRTGWPDLLVSDIGLPVRDGYELIREVRSMQPPAGAAPLGAVALTAFARLEDRERALEAGFDEHVPKPLNAHALVSAIRTVIERRAGG
jgi:PAS domain S-box-containing protein